MTFFTIKQKRVDVYPGTKPGSPVIYLNMFSNAVNSVYKNLLALGCPDFSLADMIACSFPKEIHSIGIVMRHRAKMIASILAVLKCGGRYVPAEPDFPTGRIHDMMKETQVDFILTEQAFAPKLEDFPIRYGDHNEENKSFEKQPDGSVMYRSGDLGYILPDGNLAFLHRKDNQIMIYGKRVEIAEVESRLYQCKDVQQAVVRAFTDEKGLSYMTAYVVPSDKKLQVSKVKKELSKNLTAFMIPEFFVEMKQIPLNINGKPDVSQLPVVMKAGTI